MLQTFWSDVQGRKSAHLSKDFAVNLAGRSMGGTDGSRKRQAFGHRALKCCEIKRLECCNVATSESRLFRVALAKGNVHENAGSLGF